MGLEGQLLLCGGTWLKKIEDKCSIAVVINWWVAEALVVCHGHFPVNISMDIKYLSSEKS